MNEIKSFFVIFVSSFWYFIMKQGIENLTFERMREIVDKVPRRLQNNLYMQSDIVLSMGDNHVFPKFLELETPFSIQDFRCGYIRSGKLSGIINLSECHLTAGTMVFVTPGSIVQPLLMSDDFEIVGMGVSEELIHLSLGNQLPDIFNVKANDGQLLVDGNEIAFVHRMFQLLWDVVHAGNDRREVMLNLIAATAHEFDAVFSRNGEPKVGNGNTQTNILNRFMWKQRYFGRGCPIRSRKYSG